MDQLRADHAAQGVSHLPRGWQFVHIDVPRVSEPGPMGLGSVQDQGGTYLGVGSVGAGYRVLDGSSLQTAGRREAPRLHRHSWAPREPDRVIVPIADNTGQYRAVGRMLTLSGAVEYPQCAADRMDNLHSRTCWEMKGSRCPACLHQRRADHHRRWQAVRVPRWRSTCAGSSSSAPTPSYRSLPGRAECIDALPRRSAWA